MKYEKKKDKFFGLPGDPHDKGKRHLDLQIGDFYETEILNKKVKVTVTEKTVLEDGSIVITERGEEIVSNT